MRWEEVAQNDALQILEMWEWKKRHDREMWRRFLREVRTLKGLQHRTCMDGWILTDTRTRDFFSTKQKLRPLAQSYLIISWVGY